MSPTSTDLLRLLGASGGAGINRAAGPNQAGAGAPPTGVEHADFAELLKKASTGQMSTGLPVDVDAASGLKFAPEDLARLGKAADAAEAAGLHTALVMMDNKAYVLDVHARAITKGVNLTAGGGGVVTGIDGVVTVPKEGDATVSASAAKGPAGVLPPNASVAKLLESVRNDGSSARSSTPDSTAA